VEKEWNVFGRHSNQLRNTKMFLIGCGAEINQKIFRAVNLNKLIIHNLTLQQIDKISNDFLIGSTSK
jgi:hypothetical protein